MKKKLEELEKRIEALEKREYCKHLPVIMSIQFPKISQSGPCRYCGVYQNCLGHVIF